MRHWLARGGWSRLIWVVAQTRVYMKQENGGWGRWWCTTRGCKGTAR